MKVKGFIQAKREELTLGTQIIYVPGHVNSIFDVRRGAVERGFVWEVTERVIRCRFFHPELFDLRTMANSEACNIQNLMLFNYADQSEINAVIDMLVDSVALRYMGE